MNEQLKARPRGYLPGAKTRMDGLFSTSWLCAGALLVSNIMLSWILIDSAAEWLISTHKLRAASYPGRIRKD